MLVLILPQCVTEGGAVARLNTGQNQLLNKDCNKRQRCYMTKESIHLEDITFVNMYAPNIAPEHIKQILTDWKGEIDSSIVIE